MTSIDPAVSVVVPVRNEAGNIAPLVTEIAKALNGKWPFEVVYVDDGSSDATEVELQQLITQHAWLRRVRHKQSCGQSAAVCTGVAAARAPIVVTLDGDGQNDPAFISALIRTLEARARHVPASSLDSASVARRVVSRSFSRASPMPCAVLSCGMERATRAAA